MPRSLQRGSSLGTAKMLLADKKARIAGKKQVPNASLEIVFKNGRKPSENYLTP